MGLDSGRTFDINGQSVTVADDYSAGIVRSLVSTLSEKPGSDAAKVILNTLVNREMPRKGTRELLLAYRQMPHLRSVVGRIAVSCSAVNWRVYRVSGGVSKRSFKHHDISVRKAKIEKALTQKDLVEIQDHPLVELMDTFNPEMSGVAGRRLLQIYQELKGESFHIIERDESGTPIELWPVPTHWVYEVPKKGSDYFVVTSRQGQQVQVAAENMLYIKDLDPENPYARGSGTGEALGDELDVDEMTAKHMKSWFANRCIPAYLIGVPGAGEEEVEIARNRWEERNRGVLRSNRVHFHNGEMSAIRLDDKFADMQIVDVRKFEAQIIRETWNVPPEVVGHLESSNRATAEQAMAIMSMLVVQPRLEFLRAELQQKLVPQFADGESLVLEYDDPIPVDRTFQLEQAKAAPWSISVNEWRKIGGQEPIDGGDDLHMLPAFGTFGPLTATEAETDPQASTPGGLDIEPPPAKSVNKAIGEAAINDVLAVFRPQTLAGYTAKNQKKVVKDFGVDMMRTIGVGAEFSMVAPAVINHLAQYSSERITEINQTTKNQIAAQLADGVASGEGIDKLATRIRDVMGYADKVRARLIARTEVVRSGNFARLESMDQVGAGVVDAKEWLTEMDDVTRNSHAEMNGTVVPIRDEFDVPANTNDAGTVVAGPTKMLYPGDSAEAGQVCNCRCTMLPVLDDNKGVHTVEQQTEAWRSFDREAALHEGILKNDWRKAFKEQEHLAIQALMKQR